MNTVSAPFSQAHVHPDFESECKMRNRERRTEYIKQSSFLSALFSIVRSQFSVSHFTFTNRDGVFHRAGLNKRRRAFTLIELMICISILGMISLVGAGLLASMETARVRTQDRIEADAQVHALTARWREDVHLASAIEILEEGRRLRIECPPEADAREITYSLTAQGEIERVETGRPGEPVKRQTLARAIESLAFEPAGRGVRLSLAGLPLDDAVSTRVPWRSTALATPLTQVPFVMELR